MDKWDIFFWFYFVVFGILLAISTRWVFANVTIHPEITTVFVALVVLFATIMFTSLLNWASLKDNKEELKLLESIDVKLGKLIELNEKETEKK